VIEIPRKSKEIVQIIREIIVRSLSSEDIPKHDGMNPTGIQQSGGNSPFNIWPLACILVHLPPLISLRGLRAFAVNLKTDYREGAKIAKNKCGKGPNISKG